MIAQDGTPAGGSWDDNDDNLLRFFVYLPALLSEFLFPLIDVSDRLALYDINTKLSWQTTVCENGESC